MNSSELECYLHDHIPLSRAMQVSVVAMSSDRMALSAPLAPNINHRETVFGGSSSALAILSAWSLLYMRLANVGIHCRLVIQRNSMQYERPISSNFTATASLSNPVDWDLFLRTLLRKGKARINVSSVMECQNQTVGRFEGDFVALKDASSPKPESQSSTKK